MAKQQPLSQQLLLSSTKMHAGHWLYYSCSDFLALCKSNQSSSFPVVSGLCHVEVLAQRHQFSGCKTTRRNVITSSRCGYCELQVMLVLETQSYRTGMCCSSSVQGINQTAEPVKSPGPETFQVTGEPKSPMPWCPVPKLAPKTPPEVPVPCTTPQRPARLW